jgi:hypothetical protein
MRIALIDTAEGIRKLEKLPSRLTSSSLHALDHHVGDFNTRSAIKVKEMRFSQPRCSET